MSEFGCDDQYRWETDDYVCVWNCPLDNYSRKCLEDRADPLGICCENIVEFRRKEKPQVTYKVRYDRVVKDCIELTKERDEARKIARELAELIRVLSVDLETAYEEVDWLA